MPCAGPVKVGKGGKTLSRGATRCVFPMQGETLPASTVERFRAGEADAFAEVIRMLAPRVRAIARRYLPSPFQQEEAMQEVWVHAFRQREALDPERAAQFDGWLLTLARRKVIDVARQIGRQPTPVEEAEELPDDGAPAVDAVERRELGEAAAAFAERLEPDWRDFFELHFVQGLEYAEVAQRLSISRLRCKYMKKVIAARARRYRPLLEALDRMQSRGDDAP
jgi:RNA polymerase sigma-70 factor (ECF subfamily)